jgi:uncharacterized membrane-anchored protein YjiN (DUF445 family)
MSAPAVEPPIRPAVPAGGEPLTGVDSLADLQKHRLMANLCLAVAAVGWAASHLLPLPPDWAHLLRAVAEAGMIGGLADWFAVTALFRHPLGLPIPHTALVPRNRDRIADGIARYIDQEFLEPGRLLAQLRKMELARRAAEKLDLPENRTKLAEIILGMLPGLVREEREAAIRGTLTTALRQGLRDVDLRPPLARLLRSVVRSDAMESLIQDLAERLILMIDSRTPWLEQRIASRSPWWIPGFVDQKLAGSVSNGLVSHLHELKDPRSAPGGDLRRWLLELADGIETGSPLGERIAQAAAKLLEGDGFARLVAGSVTTLRRMALEDMARPDGNIRQAVDGIVASLAEQLHDPALRARIDASLEEAFLAGLPKWRSRIVGFIAATLRAQPLEQFTARLENRVGKDMQFIRINGTVLGALIGGLLYGLNRWLDS